MYYCTFCHTRNAGTMLKKDNLSLPTVFFTYGWIRNNAPCCELCWFLITLFIVEYEQLNHQSRVEELSHMDRYDVAVLLRSIYQSAKADPSRSEDG